MVTQQASVASALDLGILAEVNTGLLNKAEAKVGAKTDDILAGYLNKVEAEQRAAVETRDPKLRAEKLNLQNTQFKGVREAMATDKKDLGDVVMGFMEFAKQLDLQVEGLFTPTAEQQARVAQAEARLSTAVAEQATAPTRSTWFGARDPVATAKTELEAAQSALVEIKAAIAREVSEHARNANIEENLALLQTHGERAYAALVESHRVLLARTEAIKRDKEAAFAMAQKTRTMIEGLDTQITDLQAQFETAKELLDHATQDDPNYATLQKDASALEAQLQTKNQDRTALLGVSREEAINAQEYVGYEKSAITMTGDAKSLAAIVQTKNRNMAAKRQHYVSQMAQIKQIERAVEVIRTGNEVDRRLLDTILQAGAAATNARQGIMQEQPTRLADVQRRLDEQDAMLLQQAGIDRKIRDDFNRRFLGGDQATETAATN